MVTCVFTAWKPSNVAHLFDRRSVPARILTLSCGVLGLAMSADSAFAQSSYALDFYRPQTLISPTIPTDYDRGGNLSIESQPRPDYNPLPIELGTLSLFPQLDTYIGGSSNVLLGRSNAKPDMVVGTALSLYAAADWGSSNFTLAAKDWQNVWVNNAIRSQNQGNIDAAYQIDITDNVKAAVEGAFLRYGDNNLIGSVNSLGSILLTESQSIYGAHIQYTTGHFSEVLSIDRQHWSLDPVYSPMSGLTLNYYDNHSVLRVSSQTEYAITPSFSIFGQFRGYKTTYNYLLPENEPNYDSLSYRFLAGVSLDISGLLRGQISAGFGHRDYDSSLYKTPTALAIASRLEFFPDVRDNITFTLVKDFDDGTIYFLAPQKYTSMSIIYEREVRKNILAGFQLNKFTAASLATNSTGTDLSNYGGVIFIKYMINHHFSMKFEIGGERDNTPNIPITDYVDAPNTEFRSLLTLSFTP